MSFRCFFRVIFICFVLNMGVIYKFFIVMIVFDLSIAISPEFFNLSLTMTNTAQMTDKQSIYIATELPVDEDLYIVDFHPIYDRQTVHSITTYLCTKPFVSDQDSWFDPQPCFSMDRSAKIYKWTYNIPAVKWPKDAGFQVGRNTSYQYIVIHIQYLSSIINDIYGEQITMTRTRPPYKIGIYDIMTDALEFQKTYAAFSCRYHSSPIYVFSTLLNSNFDGRSISLYRVRNNRLRTIIQGDLQWPQTFYQLENSIRIRTNDYLIGACTYENKAITRTGSRDVICQITMMFSMKLEDRMTNELCTNNNFPRTVDRFLPVDLDTPETLFDINPIYPKLTPTEWGVKYANISSKLMESSNDNVDALSSDDDQAQGIFRVLQAHRGLSTIGTLILLWVVGVVVLFIIIGSNNNKKHEVMHRIRSKPVAIGGNRSSLSAWLTKQRFQQNGNHHGEYEPLTREDQKGSSSEEMDLSDSEVYNTSDFQNVILKS